MRSIPVTLLVWVLLVASGCDTTQDSVHEAQPVVEAYLVAGQPLPEIRLSWSAAINATYDLSALGIADATVRVDRIGADGSVEHGVGYRPLLDRPGLYGPEEADVVRAGATYSLDVRFADGARLSSSTIVPGAFEIIRSSENQVVYQGGEQFELELTPSLYPGRPGIYVITIEGLDPRPAALTPFYLDAIYEVGPGEAFDPDTLDVGEIVDLVEVTSPPLNEANYRKPGEATVTTQLPWFTVVFYGQNRVSISAIDDNVYDFVRFQAAQRGGSTLSPGEIPNILDSVEGGIGVFGSYAPVSAVVNVIPGN